MTKQEREEGGRGYMCYLSDEPLPENASDMFKKGYYGAEWDCKHFGTGEGCD